MTLAKCLYVDSMNHSILHFTVTSLRSHILLNPSTTNITISKDAIILYFEHWKTIVSFQHRKSKQLLVLKWVFVFPRLYCPLQHICVLQCYDLLLRELIAKCTPKAAHEERHSNLHVNFEHIAIDYLNIYHRTILQSIFFFWDFV